MAVKSITIHAIQIEDKPGSLHKLLSAVAAEGVDLNCLSACACPGGTTTAYLSAKNPDALKAYAAKAGIKAAQMAGFMFTGEDKVGAAANALKPLAVAGVNGIAATAMVSNGGYGMVVIVSLADAIAAARALGA